MPASTHIIRRQIIDVLHHGNMDGLALQQDVERMWYDKLLHECSLLLDRYDADGIVTIIDKLDIHVSGMTADDIRNGNTAPIMSQLENVLQEQLANTSNASSADKLAVRQHSFSGKWLFYLEHGYLPWWSTAKDITDWKQELALFLDQPFNMLFLSDLRVALKKEQVRQRLRAQVDEQQFRKIVAALLSLSAHEITLLCSDLDKLVLSVKDMQQGCFLKTAALEKLLDYIARSMNSAEIPVAWAKDLTVIMQEQHIVFPGRKTGDSLETPALKKMVQESLHEIVETPGSAAKEKISVQDENMFMQYDESYHEGLYVSNAGLVIIAPYLPVFFDRAGLREGKELRNTGKCVQLLNYLATGISAAEEFECVMPKLLCGLMPDVFTDVSGDISDDEKETSDDLLRAVIANWTILKNTSPDGLRQTFLQREGKLTLHENIWTLQVQQETYDILLQHLPWSISMIKLPWMEQLLQVKWE